MITLTFKHYIAYRLAVLSLKSQWGAMFVCWLAIKMGRHDAAIEIRGLINVRRIAKELGVKP